MTSTAHSRSNGAQYGIESARVGVHAGSLLARLLITPIRWWKRHQSRDELISMDDHMLADIGLTRGDAVIEWQKAFWEA